MPASEQESVLFQIYERVYLAASELAFPLPKRFLHYFIVLAYRVLDIRYTHTTGRLLKALSGVLRFSREIGLLKQYETANRSRAQVPLLRRDSDSPSYIV